MLQSTDDEIEHPPPPQKKKKKKEVRTHVCEGPENETEIVNPRTPYICEGIGLAASSPQSSRPSVSPPPHFQPRSIQCCGGFVRQEFDRNLLPPSKLKMGGAGGGAAKHTI